MLDKSDNSESDSASEDAETGTVDHEIGARRKVHTRVTTDASPAAPEKNDDLSSSLHRTREEDRKKGRAISRQTASEFHPACYLDLYLVSRLFGTRFLMPAFAYKNLSRLEIASPLQVAVHFLSRNRLTGRNSLRKSPAMSRCMLIS